MRDSLTMENYMEKNMENMMEAIMQVGLSNKRAWGYIDVV